jgi:protein LTV1
MGKGGKFIDKKTAKHYNLLHRAHVDDEAEPNRVLVEKKSGKTMGKERVASAIEELEEGDRVGLAALYGVYFNDDAYNYMKHLRTVGQVGAVMLEAPKSKQEVQELKKKDKHTFALKEVDPVEVVQEVVEVEVEELDPDVLDVLKALEDSAGEDMDADVDDVFGQLTLAPAQEEWDEEGDEYEYEEYDEEEPARSGHLGLLDRRFEQLEHLYDQDDDEEDQPAMTTQQEFEQRHVATILQEFLQEEQSQRGNILVDLATTREPQIMEQIKQAQRKTKKNVSSVDLLHEQVTQPEEQWDCESIISTYSNLENHPTMLDQTRRRRPILDAIQESSTSEEEDIKLVANKGIPRNKHETPEEKRLRKQQIKQDRQTRREERKSNTQLVKQLAKPTPQSRRRPID